MNVRLEHNFANDSYRVWLFERSPFRVLRLTDGGRFTWEYPPSPEAVAEPAPPSFELPVDALQALLQEAGKVLPATHATERHLLDSIAVRDRLLELVEQGWTS